MTPHTLPPPGEERHAVSLARCGWMHQAVLPLRGDTLANSCDLTKATLSQPPCHRCCGNGDSHSGPYHRHASLSPTPPVAVASPHLSAAHRMFYVCRLSPSPPFSSPCQQAAVMFLSHPHLHRPPPHPSTPRPTLHCHGRPVAPTLPCRGRVGVATGGRECERVSWWGIHGTPTQRTSVALHKR